MSGIKNNEEISTGETADTLNNEYKKSRGEPRGKGVVNE